MQLPKLSGLSDDFFISSLSFGGLFGVLYGAEPHGNFVLKMYL